MAIIFLKETELNLELERIIEDSDVYLYLISPYIKLHDRMRRELLNKKECYDLKIVVVFGKNEEDMQKSLSSDDFEFLAEFPNVEIRYESKLHAKYYASEDRVLITSMNLHEFSQNNNIEVGILMDVKSIVSVVSSLITHKEDPEYDALTYFENVIKQAEIIYQKEPIFESSSFGFKKTYKGSQVKVNNSHMLFKEKPNISIGFKNFANVKSDTNIKGFCIRTGKPIPFDLKRPFSDEGYRSWVKFKNEEFPEKYCHFTGELSNSSTSFKHPVLRKNWKKMKETLGE